MCASPPAARPRRSATTGAAASSSATANGRAWSPNPCSPPTCCRYARRGLPAQLKRAGDLKGPSLLRVAHAAEDWPLWLKAAGVARITARGPEFQFYGQALQAAVDGLGVAMGIRPYIDDDLAAGRLVAPFALSVPKGMRWYLVYRGFRTEQRDFVAFRRWIIRTAAIPADRRARRSFRLS